jgi:hypothetical protein
MQSSRAVPAKDKSPLYFMLDYRIQSRKNSTYLVLYMEVKY